MTRDRCLSVRITGRVQGVWFRGWTRREARRLGLRGWVRNEPDGSVLALIAGPDDALSDMVKAMHRGPRHARVERVEIEESNEAVPDGFSEMR